MNKMLSTVGAMAAVAQVASTAYYYAEQFGVFNREAKVEAETRSVEVVENQSADVGIPVFNGCGYEIWSSMMKTLFLSQDLWDMVDGGYIEEELIVEVLREVRKKDAVALLFIQQAIDKSVFSCIAGASKSKEAWDALQKKYQGDAQESNRPNSVDELVLSYPADATECREAWNALEVEYQGYTDEPNQKKAVDDPKEAAWDAPQQGHNANTKVVEVNRIGIEFGVFNSNCGFKEGCSANSYSGCDGGRDDWHFKMNHSDNGTPAAESTFHSKLKLSEDGIGKECGDIKNNNCGSKKGSRGISNLGHGGRGGRNCGRHFNNNQGGHGGQDGECSNNRGSHGGTGNGDFNNSQGGRGGQRRGHININRGGHGGKGRGHINNKGHSEGPFVSKQESAKATEMTTSTKVYVGNLSESTTKEDLREVFGYFGTIANIVVVRDGDGKSKCFGFVNFKDADDASWCIEVLNGHKFDNKEWCVRAFQKKHVKGAKKKSVYETVPSSTANASESKKARDAVSEKKFIAKPQKKSVNESVPSSTAKATESKTSGDAVSQKKFNGRAEKKSVDESVPSSTANETESKKAVVAVQKVYRAITRVLYVDDKGVAHFKLKKSIVS